MISPTPHDHRCTCGHAGCAHTYVRPTGTEYHHRHWCALWPCVTDPGGDVIGIDDLEACPSTWSIDGEAA